MHQSIDDPRLQLGFVPADPDLASSVRRRATSLWGAPPDALVVAPGRIEIVGNHVDYNGGEVVAAAVDRWVAVAARRRNDNQIRVTATQAGTTTETFLLSLVSRFDRRISGADPSWTDYALAAIAALNAAGHQVGGVELYYRGTIPVGMGLSSSSALLVCLTAAVSRAFGVQLDKLSLARIAQDAEHRTGAPVGMLDQVSSAVGGVLRFSNDPARIRGLRANLGDAVFALCDSGVRHSLPGSRYAIRVGECQQALALLCANGFEIATLAALPHAELDRALAILPDPLGRRVRHVVEEVERTARAEQALEAGDATELGRLMNASGESSATLYDISHPAVEAIITMARQIPGVYGARMMGGGDGGAAIILAERIAIDTLRATFPHHAVTVCRIARGMTYVE